MVHDVPPGAKHPAAQVLYKELWNIRSAEATCVLEMRDRMKSRKEQAVALFREGYNCSQSVFVTYADLFGMDKETALKVSASFGAGIGRMREVCGAACGMFMVAGMLTGQTEGADQAAKKRNYDMVQLLAEEFKKENGGTYICRELLANAGAKAAAVSGADGNTVPEARTEDYYKKRPCLKTIEGAAGIVERMLFSGMFEENEVAEAEKESEDHIGGER